MTLPPTKSGTRSNLVKTLKLLIPLAFLIVLVFLYWQFHTPAPSTAPSPDTNQNAPNTYKLIERAIAAGTLKSIEDDKGNSFDAVVVDLERSDLHLYLLDDTNKPIGSFKHLNEIVGAKGSSLIFAMNAGIFGKDNMPLGLHVDGGGTLRPINMDAVRTDLPGNFYLKPNGVFAIRDKQAYIDETLHLSESHQDTSQLSLATQSGPLLVLNGQINPQFQPASPNKTIRNGVGVIDPHTVVFIISRAPVSLYDFASLFRDQFTCQNALYLDGAISKMYIPEIDGQIDESRFAGMLGITIQSR